jgi:hypothetical protein
MAKSIFEQAGANWQGPVTGLWWDGYDHLDDLVREYDLAVRIEPIQAVEDPSQRTVNIWVKGKQFAAGIKFLREKLCPEEESETQKEEATAKVAR